MYDPTLCGLDPEDEDRPRIFRILLAAKRPLGSLDLCSNLEVHLEDQVYDETRQIEGPLEEWLFSVCGPLVEIQNDKVQFIQATVPEYIQNHSHVHFRVTGIDGHVE